MDTVAQPDSAHSALSVLTRQTKRLAAWLIVLTVLFVVSVGTLSALLLRREKASEDGLAKIEAEQKDLTFSIFETDYAAANDFVEPKVNTMQFLRHGYTIDFETVEYRQEGLVLSGRIGNPTHLLLTSLALQFTARPYVYKVKEKWQKQSIPWWSSEWNVGTGQTTIGTLNPGTTVPFRVTIPNVKQTNDTDEIAVTFSGEYYQYVK